MRFRRRVVIIRAAIWLQQDGQPSTAQIGQRTAQQRGDVRRLPVGGADVVAFGPQQFEDLERALGRVEADGISRAAAARRIIRQDERDAALVRGLARQSCPVGRQARHIVDAVGNSHVLNAGEFETRIDRRLFLEGDRTRQQAAVEFRQHDVHREIRRRQAARRVGPCRSRAAGQHDLQHGHVGLVEDRRVVVPHRREGSGVEDDRGPARGDQCRERRIDRRILQAAHRHGERGQTQPDQRRHQRLDRRHVAGHQIGAIEDDQGRRAIVPGPADHRERPDRRGRLMRQAGRKAQRVAEVFRAAFAEEAVEHLELRGGRG